MFLSDTEYTIATEQRDFPEWHRDRPDYALWYIEVEHPQLLAYLENLRKNFEDMLIPSQRQFHITLFVCGFLKDQNCKQYNDDFSTDQLYAQCLSLKEASLQPFKIVCGGLETFSTALFVKVNDLDGVLETIRACLSQHANEIAAVEYCPHITLGLYKDHYSVQEIRERMDDFSLSTFDMDIKNLRFGCYQPKVLQGEISALVIQDLDER